MKTVEKLLAERLLNICAIKLQPANPFTWASGWNSPIYTDNRRTLSYPEVRSFIKVELCRLILENFPEVDAIAGVATGAIAQVVNTMGALAGGGIKGAIVFLLVFVFGHLLNFAINVLGAFIHSARLQFVEFFGKFYVDGGEAFDPLRKNTKFIKIENK